MLKERPKPVAETSVKYQYLATLVVNLLMIAHGICGGWPSPALSVLTTDDSPLPSGKINMEEASWIASAMCIGGFFGNIFFGFVTNSYGRKIPLILTAIPSITAWVLILIAKDVYYLYVARTLNGFVGGGLLVIIPLFLSEIASDRVRGFIGSTVLFSYNFGMLIVFILGNYCDYHTPPKIVIGITILCVVCFYFCPESPPCLMKQGKDSKTEKAIKFYQNMRGKSSEHEMIQNEMTKLRSLIGGSNDEKKGNSFKWSDLFHGRVRKAMIIGIVLAGINQFCGCFAMLNYTANIFKEAGSVMSPNNSAIVVGVILMLGSCCATFLVDRTGRKFLYSVSTVGTAIGLITLGTYSLLKSYNFDVEPYNWIPVASFSFVIFIASWAVTTLSYLVISEIMPENIKDFGVSFCVGLVWVFSFVVVKMLPFLISSLEFHGTMFLFAGCCLLSALFIIICMPETRGKSYEEIMKLL